MKTIQILNITNFSNIPIQVDEREYLEDSSELYGGNKTISVIFLTKCVFYIF